jgi:hypothetical protein
LLEEVLLTWNELKSLRISQGFSVTRAAVIVYSEGTDKAADKAAFDFLLPFKNRVSIASSYFFSLALEIKEELAECEEWYAEHQQQLLRDFQLRRLRARRDYDLDSSIVFVCIGELFEPIYHLLS